MTTLSSRCPSSCSATTTRPEPNGRTCRWTADISPVAASQPRRLAALLPDDDLAALLGHRPDVALPAPSDLTTLANRLAVRSSIARAVDALDAFSLRVLEVVTLLGE